MYQRVAVAVNVAIEKTDVWGLIDRLYLSTKTRQTYLYTFY